MSEFKEPFLFSKLYPTLFPDGVGDPRMDGRLSNPSLDKYIRYWMEFVISKTTVDPVLLTEMQYCI